MKLVVNYSKKKKENVGGNEIRIHALIDTTICQIAIIWIKKTRLMVSLNTDWKKL
jgi:hypothetical protein